MIAQTVWILCHCGALIGIRSSGIDSDNDVLAVFLSYCYTRTYRHRLFELDHVWVAVTLYLSLIPLLLILYFMLFTFFAITIFLFFFWFYDITEDIILLSLFVLINAQKKKKKNDQVDGVALT